MRLVRLLAGPAILGALGLAQAGSAEIYRWTDAGGRLHFTERLENVPLEHREQAIEAARQRSVNVTTFSGDGVPAAPRPGARRSRARRSEIRIPFVREGTLMRVNVRLNDSVTAPFLIDTGASGVSLPSRVAERLGIRLRPDTPRVRVTTANGVVSVPVIQLESIDLGGARVEGLYATVNPRMDIGLLGGTFFNNFVYRVDAAESVISLIPNENIRGGMGEEAWRQRFDSVREPLAELKAHLATDEVRREGERNYLERRREELEAALERLELEANRLNVPHAWRR